MNHVSVGEPSATGFLRAACAHYARLALHERLARHSEWRSPVVVRREYDAQRQRELDVANELTWDEMLYGRESDLDFILEDDSIVWDTLRQPLALNLSLLGDVVESEALPGDTVVEFCSGDGRNLLYLKQRFPDVHFVGLEISPVSVATARRLAEKFAVDVEFLVCDVTRPLPEPVSSKNVTVAFSSHGLEQMPRIFPGAVEAMCALAARHILMLEPVPELWPRNVRGLSSRLRVLALDRLRGLIPFLEGSHLPAGWHLESVRRLGTACNPLNETCELHLTH
jgi:hypothetical protein